MNCLLCKTDFKYIKNIFERTKTAHKFVFVIFANFLYLSRLCQAKAKGSHKAPRMKIIPTTKNPEKKKPEIYLYLYISRKVISSETVLTMMTKRSQLQSQQQQQLVQ